jgi:septation ring formation regulator EzrA
MGLFPQKIKTQPVTYIDKLLIVVAGKKYHSHDHELQEIKSLLTKILKNQNNMAVTLAEVKAKLAAQDTALDSIGTNVTGVQGDVAALKAKIEELSNGADAAVSAALGELSPLVDAVGTKIDAIGATTAALDAETT